MGACRDGERNVEEEKRKGDSTESERTGKEGESSFLLFLLGKGLQYFGADLQRRSFVLSSVLSNFRRPVHEGNVKKRNCCRVLAPPSRQLE